jgi:hypothetical protein
MPDLATVTVAGVVVLAILVVVFMKLRRQDLLGAIEKKRSDAKIVSRADYVEGGESIPVVLSLVGETFYYENPDLDASFDLNRIDEIEYGDELSTGKTLEDSHRVLRLRSHGRTIEFVMPKAEAQKWMPILPQRRIDEQPPSARAL